MAKELDIKSLLLVAIEDSKVLLEGISQKMLRNGYRCLDTNASFDTTSEKNLFYDFNETFKGRVYFGDGSRIIIEGRGNILINTHLGSQTTLKMLFTL